MLRILYLINTLQSGGAERQLVETAIHLDKRRFRAFVVYYDGEIHYRELLDHPEIEVARLPKSGKFSPLFLLRLIRHIRRNRIDIVHSFLNNAAFWARIAGFASRVSVITSIRCTRIHPFWYALEKCMKWVDGTTLVNSLASRREYLRNVRSRKLLALHNGIDEERAGGFEKRDYSVGPELRIVSVGRIAPQKDYLCSFRALAEIRGRLACRWDVYGRVQSPAYQAELEEFLRSRGIGEVNFCGEAREIYPRLRDADVLVLSSAWEGLPNAVLEASIVGLPVIASDVSDVRCAVRDGENGFLFRPGDERHLAQLLLGFSELSEEGRRKLGEGGKRIARENFGMSAMVRRLEDLYLASAETK